jgi:hypothetical protein
MSGLYTKLGNNAWENIFVKSRENFIKEREYIRFSICCSIKSWLTIYKFLDLLLLKCPRFLMSSLNMVLFIQI